MPLAALESKLLDKIEGLSQFVAKLSEEIARMSVQIKNIDGSLHETRQHGDRITKLETEVVNLKSNEKSAATERRWIIGTLVSAIGVMLLAAIAVAGVISQVWAGKPHP